MKNKILLRLVLYFVTSFLIFAIVIGIIFSVLFSRYNLEIHKVELERQAVSVANALSDILEEDSLFETGMNRGMRGRGMRGSMGMMDLYLYLQFIEDMVNCSIWVVDYELGQIDFGGRHRHMQLSLNSGDLPNYAEQVITYAFAGTISTNESFSGILGMPTITTAAPIIFQDGTIPGVVLLHSYISEANTVTSNGLTILIFSMLTAVFISIFVAFALSFHFTKPLNKMKVVALQISGGDYEVKTGVEQVDEIGELASVLDDMADKLAMSAKERAKFDKLRNDFVANISHELRTPITVIRSSLEALLDGVVSDKVKVTEFHGQMLNECKYLERLVTDLLDLSRLQNVDFAIETQVVDIKDVVEDVIRIMSRVAQHKKVDLTFTCNKNNFSAIGDYGRLRQMLIIVVDNAIKFSPEKSSVVIDLEKIVNCIQIHIRDQGCGIPIYDIDYIFDRFYKQRSEHNKTGSGLGLAIAKQIADRHSITIKVVNIPDGGAEFTFEIPLIVD